MVALSEYSCQILYAAVSHSLFSDSSWDQLRIFSMSRHRNVRNMMAEEYDDYGDDYDDYDDFGVAPQPVQKKKKKKKKAAAAPACQGSSSANTDTVTTQSAAKSPTPKAAASTKDPSRGVGLTVLPAAKVSSGTPPRTATSAPSSANSVATRPVPPILLQKKSKPSLTIVILGHVDAGKSTLTGHLLWAKGSASSVGNRRPPTNFAWLLDEDEEERQHGVTMEVATKTLATDLYDIVINDAPGHADYVPSMITGTASSDAAVVVVDATDFGTSLGAGQLREHLLLAKGLGISQLIFAINKMDMLAWSQDAYNDMQTQLDAFAQHTLGYNDKKLQFLPISGLTGVNVVKEAIDVPELTEWYKGPTLWQALDQLEPPPMGPKLLEKPVRLIVTDVVGEVGKGMAVRARVVTGWVEAGEPLIVSPVQDETTLTKMTRLQATSDDVEREKYAVAGELIDVVLPGIDPSRISVGHILARPGLLPPMTTRCRAKIFIFDGLAIPIIRGAQAIFHMHYLDVPCHLSGLLQTLKPNGTVLKERPRVLPGKIQAIVEITLHYPVAMEAFGDCRALGRFVLRRSGTSIAVGRVEEVFLN